MIVKLKHTNFVVFFQNHFSMNNLNLEQRVEGEREIEQINWVKMGTENYFQENQVKLIYEHSSLTTNNGPFFFFSSHTQRTQLNSSKHKAHGTAHTYIQCLEFKLSKIWWKMENKLPTTTNYWYRFIESFIKAWIWMCLWVCARAYSTTQNIEYITK